MMNRRAPLLLLSVAFPLLGTTLASAGMISEYSDRSAFEVAAGVPLVVEDFTDTFHFPISTGVLNSSTNLVVETGPPILPGDIEAGVTYSTLIGESFFFNIDGGGGFEGGFLDGFTQNFDNVLTIDFDNPVAAFGFDTNRIMGRSFELLIEFTSGPSYQQTFAVPASPDLVFFGFVSTLSDIASVQILSDGASGFSFALDNFTFSGGVIPEPTAMLSVVLGGGLLLGGGALRRGRSTRSVRKA